MFDYNKPPSGNLINYSPSYLVSEEPKTTTFTRRIRRELPEQQEMTYQEAGIPDPMIKRIRRKEILTTTPDARKQYYKKIDDYNRKVAEAKKEIDEYNRKVREYNLQRIYYDTVSYDVTHTERTYMTPLKSEIPIYEVADTKSSGLISPLEADLFLRSQQAQSTTIGIPKAPSFIERYGLSLRHGFKTLYWGLPKSIGQDIREAVPLGFKTLFTKGKKPEISKALEKSISDLGAGGKIVLQPATDIYIGGTILLKGDKMETASALSRSTKDLYSGAIYGFTTPEGLGTMVTIGSAFMIPYAVKNAPRLVTSAKYKMFGVERPATDFYSAEALKSPKGLDLTYTPKKTISAFEKGFGKTPELPNQYVGVHQSRTFNLGTTVKTRQELASMGLKQGSESGFFISPKGAGQTLFLGVGETPKYKFSLNPLEWFKSFKKQGHPTTHQIGFKEIGAYPKEILTPLSQTKLEQYQLAQVGKSKAIITRMSLLGTKKEPEAIFSITESFVPVKTKLQYTIVKGQTIPIKTYTIPQTISSTTKTVSLSNMLKGTKATEQILYSQTPVVSSINISPSILASPYIFSSISSRTSRIPASSSVLQSSSMIPSGSRISSPSRIPSITTPIISKSISRTVSDEEWTYGKTTYTSIIPSYSTPSKPTIPSYTSKPYRTPDITYRIPPPSTTPKSKTKQPDLLRKTFEPAYDTYVKEKSQWIKANRPDEKNCINTAIQLGAKITDNTVARSFKVKKASGQAKNILPQAPNLYKFYRPSKRRAVKLTGAYIEKSKFAIDTVGELQGITAKGWIARRKKKGLI